MARKNEAPDVKKQAPEVVIREFPPAGKFRVRVVKNSRTGKLALDVREYVSGEGFEGFTRRGIRLGDPEQIRTLQAALEDILDPESQLMG